VARKGASIPWYVFRKKEEKGAKLALERYKALTKQGDYVNAVKYRKKAYDDQEIIEDGYLSKLIKRPNPNQGQDQFFENAIIERMLGESDIWLNRGMTGGDVLEMFVLPSQYVSLIPDPDDLFGVLGYTLDANGRRLGLAKEDVVQWKSINPEFDAYTRTHLRGLSPLKAAYKTYLMDLEANKAGVAMYANGGAKGVLMPGLVGTSHANYTNEQATTIKDTVNRTINSSEVRGAVGVFQSRWDYINFGLSATDMDLLNSMKLTREQLCQVFGVPAVLFSTDSMADNNYQNAQRDLVTNLIVPLLSTLRDELNRVLAYGEGTYIDFDVTALPELQRDFEKQVKALKDADFLSYDEKRIAIGYEPKGGVYDSAYVNSGLVKLEDLGIDLTVPDGNQDMADSGSMDALSDDGK
jgi:HK97 family phage portal protein